MAAKDGSLLSRSAGWLLLPPLRTLSRGLLGRLGSLLLPRRADIAAAADTASPVTELLPCTAASAAASKLLALLASMDCVRWWLAKNLMPCAAASAAAAAAASSSNAGGCIICSAGAWSASREFAESAYCLPLPLLALASSATAAAAAAAAAAAFASATTAASCSSKTSTHRVKGAFSLQQMR
jgi:hypothetical protein